MNVVSISIVFLYNLSFDLILSDIQSHYSKDMTKSRKQRVRRKICTKSINISIIMNSLNLEKAKWLKCKQPITSSRLILDKLIITGPVMMAVIRRYYPILKVVCIKMQNRFEKFSDFEKKINWSNLPLYIAHSRL